MRVSVVICTYNRAEGVRDTLRCLSKQQYPDFEVVVVNGPSTDHTESVLDEFRQIVRTERCPAPNLSMSRNIGIRAATGDIVAFIDDDALPEFNWLGQAVPAFAEEDVAGVGGIVFDHTGVALQYKFSAANRFAEAIASDAEPYDSYSSPGSFTFPYLQGTNALFLREALLAVGGFDETFDYYLDETDLCCRLVDAGYILRQLPNAAVHHKFLPSGIRDHQRIVTNWYPIIKNHVYFAYRHALGTHSEIEIIDRSRRFIDHVVHDAEIHEAAGRLAPGSAAAAREKASLALGKGIELGKAGHFTELARQVADGNTFCPYPIVTTEHPLRIVIVSGDYPPRLTGGIARFMGDLAPTLAALGHEVRIITRSEQHSTVDLEDGVWVHRLACSDPGERGVAPGTFSAINAFTSASASELDRIGQWAPIDVVYGPMWDVEVLGALLRTPLPIMVFLATPVAVTSGFLDAASHPHIAELMRLERDVQISAELFHANSSAVLGTIEEHYGLSIPPGHAEIIPLGLRDQRTTNHNSADGGRLRVLFVGRLEPRKGVPELLAAIATIAPQRDDVEFVLVGADAASPDGTNNLGETFTRRHRGETWISRVEFAGPVSDEELHIHYSTADIVVLPSRYESFGLVMVEAMMHSKALITCSTGGIVEFVRHDDNGWLVPPNDETSLTIALEAMIDDPALRMRLGASARESFDESLSIMASAAAIARFAATVSLLSPGEPGFSVSGPHTTTVTPGGHDGVELERGAVVSLDLAQALTTRLPMKAHVKTRLLIEDANGTTVRVVEPGSWHRIELDDDQRNASITVLDGRLTVGAVISVSREMARR